MPEYPPPYTPWNLPPRRTRVDNYPVSVIEEYATAVVRLTVPSTVWNPTGPHAELELLDLREFLLDSHRDHQATNQQRDLVWRHIGEHARAPDGSMWQLFALGMAAPVLRKLARKMTRGMSYGRTCYEHFRLIEEFLFALHRLDLTRPHVLSRVVGAAYDQATGRKLTRPIMLDINLVPDAELEPRTAVPPAAAGINERDLIGQLLQRLITRTRTAPDGYRITANHVTLVLRTRVDGEPLGAVAAAVGLSLPNASKHRTRAEMLIAHLLNRPDLAAARRPRRRVADRRQMASPVGEAAPGPVAATRRRSSPHGA